MPIIKTKRLFTSTLITVLIGTLVLSTSSIVLGQVFVGRNLGYGYGEDCHTAPTNLSATAVKAGTQLKWGKIDFADCDTKLKSYRVQLRTKQGRIVKQYIVKKTKRFVSYGKAKPGRTYKFRVRAVAKDGTITDWSSYKQFKVSTLKKFAK